MIGRPRRGRAPPSQAPPAKGTAPRLDPGKATGAPAQSSSTTPVGFVEGDGFPVVFAGGGDGADEEGIRHRRRRGLVAGRRSARGPARLTNTGAKLIGIAARQHTGWLEVAHPDGRQGLYAPHTEQGFRAPANKTLLLLANGLLAKRGVCVKARRSAG